MRPLDDPLTATLALGMISYNLARVADDDATTQNHDLDRLADETPRDRVAVGIEVDRAVRAHLAGQVAQLAERCASAERTQGIRLIGKAHDWQFTSGAVNAHVGNLPVPLIKVGKKGAPAREAAARDGIALYVADAALSRAIFTAASKAQAAADWMHAQQP